MPVRISERNRRGERMWTMAVYAVRCAAPPVCLSPILLLGSTKSGSAYCMLVVLSMWLLRLLPLPVSACLLSLFLLSVIGAGAQEDATVHGFGVDSVLLIASLSLFVAADSTSLSLRTALWLLGTSGARLRPLVFAFMTASFLGALVLPDFLVALVLSSVLEKAVVHLRSKFVSKQFRAPSLPRSPQRLPSFSPIQYECLVQEMDTILQRKIHSAPLADRSSSRTAAASRRPRERATLRKMASLMSDMCGRVTLGPLWVPTGLNTPDSPTPNETPLHSIDELPSAATSSTPTAPTRSSPSRKSSPSEQFQRHSFPTVPRRPSPPRRKARRTSCPPVVQRDAEHRSDSHARLSTRSSTSERRRPALEAWDRSQYSVRTPSRLSSVRARREGLPGRSLIYVLPGESEPEDHESGSTAELSAPHWSRARRPSSVQQANFRDIAEARSSRKLVPWNYSRDDLTRSSSRVSQDSEALCFERMCFAIRKTFIIGVVMTSTLASSCAKSTRALFYTGVPRYSFKASALVVLPTALCATVLCWAALFFAYLSEYDELQPRSSVLAIHDVMRGKLTSMGKVELQECLCISICVVTAVTCSAMLFTNQAELATCATLAALAFVFGVPSVSSLHVRDAIAQLPWNIILIHAGSMWLSAAVRDSGLAVWIFSSYTKQWFRGLTDVWQLLVILAVASLVNEGGQEPRTLSEQLVPIVSDMGLEIKGNPLFFAVPVAAVCFLPMMTPICHLGLAFIYEHTTASFGEMALLGLFLKLVTTISLTLSSTTFFAFHMTSNNDTQTTFILL